MIDRVDVESDAVEWVCDNCNRDNACAASSLTLGGPGNTDVVYFPVCSCGTQQFAIRTWDEEPRAGNPVRLAVNLLATHLRDSGRSHPDWSRHHGGEGGRRPLHTANEAVEDITGRKAARRAREEHEAHLKRLAEAPPPPAPAPPPPPADEVERERRLLKQAERRRLEVAKASVNKRLGLPPGSEPPEAELAAELARPASEFLV
jgi:hypothetical protein